MATPASPRTVLAAAVAAAVALAAAPPPLAAGVNGWTPAGLAGGTVTSLVADPSDAEIAYALVNEGGPYKTVDGGRRWVPMRTGLPAGGGLAWLAIDPRRPAVLFLGRREAAAPARTEIYLSEDAGRMWGLVAGESVTLDDRTAGDPRSSPVVAPTDPPTLYAVGVRTAEPGRRAILRSRDGGASWDPVLDESAAGYVADLAVDVQRPTTVYAAAATGFWKTDDGGDAWRHVAHVTSGAEIGGLFRLALAATDADTLYAAHTHLLRSADGGQTWERRARLPQDCFLGSPLAVDTGRSSRIYAGCAGGVWISRNAGASWDRASRGLAIAPGGAAAMVTAFAAPEATAQVVYAGSEVSGTFRTTTRGRRWGPADGGIRGAPVQQIAFRRNRARDLVIAVTGWHREPWGDGYADCVELFRSRDAGHSWILVPGPLGCASWEAVAIDPHDPSVLWAGGPGGLFLTRNDGASWRAVSALDVESLAFHPADPATLYVGGNGAFRTSDGGATWVRIVSPGPLRHVLQLVADPGDPDALYARVEDGVVGGDSIVFGLRSSDRGSSWEEIQTVSDSAPLQIAPGEPGEPSTLYQGFFRSADRGDTWEPVPAPAEGPLALFVLPTRPATLLAHGERGVYRSPDGGESWRQLDDWSTCLAAPGSLLVAHPLAPDRLFVTGCQGGLATAEFVRPRNRRRGVLNENQ